MTHRSASLLGCFCGRTYKNAIDLEEHRRARGHFPSHVCGKYCQHPPIGQYQVQNHQCGCCGKICERLDIFEDHRIATGHCFCSDCDLPFESQSALRIHREIEVHASEFRCCNCDISFQDVHALNAHMASRVHRKPLQQKPHIKESKTKQAAAVSASDQVCTKCQRVFPSSQSLQQHCESIKHKPLSILSCPVGKGCRGKFSAPSALLHHLESGDCQSGMDRDDIRHIVQLFDKDCMIHNLPALTPSSSTDLSAYHFSHSETSIVSPDTSSEWTLVTPALSQGGVEDRSLDWVLLEDNLMSFRGRDVVDTGEAKLRCPICPKRRKGFATTQALQQHIDSPVHGDKIYHCPSSLRPIDSSRTEKKGGKERQFTTLSGLAQHLESGACHGGRQTFLHCIDLIQHHLGQWGFGEMRLLLPGSRS